MAQHSDGSSDRARDYTFSLTDPLIGAPHLLGRLNATG
jgi:hypothetical protein